MRQAVIVPDPSRRPVVIMSSTDNISTAEGHSTQNYTYSDLVAINDEIATTLIPAMVIFGLLSILGVVGNSLVCYVFCFRLHFGTQNILIVYLAVFDLLSCTIAVPNEVADMRFFLTFESEASCKIMRFINTFTAMGSIWTLLVIAIDRFRKICKPFKRQIRVRQVKCLLIPIVGAALLLSWPAFVVYGLRTIDSGLPGVPGRDCSTPDNVKDTLYPLIYNMVLFAGFITLMITLIILYTRILRETNRHNRYMKNASDYYTSSALSNTDDASSELYPVTGNALPVDDIQTADTPRHNSTTSPQHSGVESRYEANSCRDIKVCWHTDTQPTSTDKDIALPTVSGSDDCQSVKDVSVLQKDDYPSSTSVHTCMSLEPISISHLDNSKAILSSGNEPVVSLDTNVSSKDGGYITVGAVDTQNSAESILLETDPKTISSEHMVAYVNPQTPSHEKGTIKKTSFENLPDRKSSSAETGQDGKCKRSRKRIRSKTTTIAFLVTLVFILSFLPHLSLQVAKFVFKGFDYNLKGASFVLYNIFLRSYFINSVSNPIIYGVLNVRFYGEVKRLLEAAQVWKKK